MEWHYAITEVVCFLDEGFTIAINHQSPNVTGTVRCDFKFGTIRTEFAHARLIKLDRLVSSIAGAFDIAVVECTLCHPNPTTGSARELMREKVRILDAESFQNHFAFVSDIVVVVIGEQYDVATVLGVA